MFIRTKSPPALIYFIKELKVCQPPPPPRYLTIKRYLYCDMDRRLIRQCESHCVTIIV